MNRRSFFKRLVVAGAAFTGAGRVWKAVADDAICYQANTIGVLPQLADVDFAVLKSNRFSLYDFLNDVHKLWHSRGNSDQIELFTTMDTADSLKREWFNAVFPPQPVLPFSEVRRLRSRPLPLP